jgi:hypothetical protein
MISECIDDALGPGRGRRQLRKRPEACDSVRTNFGKDQLMKPQCGCMYKCNLLRAVLHGCAVLIHGVPTIHVEIEL